MKVLPSVAVRSWAARNPTRRGNTGWCDATTLTSTIPVHVETGEDLARGPYQAETVPVTIEDRYIVLEF